MRITRLTAVGLLALLAAGCAGSSTSSAPPAPSSSATAGGVSSSAAAAPTTAPGQTESPVPAESNPPGDIPDNVAFVPYSNAAGRYRFDHPEGWAEQVTGSKVLFSDKLNGVTADAGARTKPPTVQEARANDVPKLQASQPAFELRSVTAASAGTGTGVHIVYRRNSAPDPVTGRRYRDEVQRYDIVANGHEVVLEMFGPVGADNVDAYKTMLTSLRIS
jgi:hypothetical protein